MALADLEELRRAIDDVDLKILGLLRERIELVLRVGDLKREKHLAVRDASREKSVLDRLAGLSRPPLEATAVRRIFERIIDEARSLEERHVARPEK